MAISELNFPGYWNEKYSSGNAVWNLNNAHPEFVRLIDEEKFIFPSKLVIPGSGLGYEALYAANKGYSVTCIDFSEIAINAAKEIAGEAGSDINFIQQDYFTLGAEFNETFDFLFEYVTLCAFPPERKEEFISKSYNLLKPGGFFITVLFPVDGRKGGPPFNIKIDEFLKIASKYFRLAYFSRSVNSVKPRKGNEVLFILRKV